MLNSLRSLGLCLLVALAMACGSSAADESEVLISLTDAVIVPGYEATATSSSELRETLEGLCASPSNDALSAAKQAWRDARAPLMRSEATWFGPVMDRRSEGLLAWPQVDPERIEAMLVNNPATTEDDVRNGLASTQRGLGAIEYLLFLPDALDLMSELVLNTLRLSDRARPPSRVRGQSHPSCMDRGRGWRCSVQRLLHRTCEQFSHYVTGRCGTRKDTGLPNSNAGGHETGCGTRTSGGWSGPLGHSWRGWLQRAGRPA